jgi:hypothetical protein
MGILMSMEAMEARTPKVPATCYQCHRFFYVYRGMPTEPPDPSTIHTRSENLPVAVCEDPQCREREHQRQLAIHHTLIRPEVEKYFAEKEAARNSTNIRKGPSLSTFKEK